MSSPGIELRLRERELGVLRNAAVDTTQRPPVENVAELRRHSRAHD
ncbi:MAG TPA: hypothetical protein VHE78_12680 [Gemmatimonadaceae bacterium]|nr:hypothetical protein [Gemmatimonadaceae bacterium]